ncbi:MAG: hypothetical protein FWC60_04515 [Firmicutes bacterium]|nr:hypothetical protein [Bacillota bacterium]
MGKLCEMTLEESNPELTDSLARSFKDGLILPAERQFKRLETVLASLKEHLEADSSAREKELDRLKKMFRLSNYISLLSLAGIITLLTVLFFWY